MKAPTRIARRQAARPLGVGAWLVAIVIGTAPATAAMPDPATDIAAYPDAVIVAHSPPQDARAYIFVTGRVERSRREPRMARSVRVAARLARVTYRTPPGTRLADVIAHYQTATDRFEPIYTCQGRDCGRSTAWANDVFGVKHLVAPDSAQFYLAATRADALVAVYIVQRGNRRVYAQVDHATGTGIGAIARAGAGGTLRQASAPAVAPPRAASASTELAATLRRQGYVVVPNAAPDADGQIAEANLQALDAIAPTLATIPQPIHVVCHLDGDAEVAEARSRVCARRGAARLRAAGVPARGFGAGSFLPRPDAPARRLELVTTEP